MTVDDQPAPEADGAGGPSSAQHPNTYVQVAYGDLRKPGESRVWDGQRLARQCLSQLPHTTRFPPQLFLVWTTADFQPFRLLLAGIRNELSRRGWAHVPVIGSSVAGCLLDGQIHEECAVLVCFASKFLRAKAAVGRDAQQCPEKGVATLLRSLDFDRDRDPGREPRPFLLTFLPGFTAEADPALYRAPEILDELRRKTANRLPMFGGVSSIGMTAGEGYQFLNADVYHGAVVAALVTTELAYGVGLSFGQQKLESTFYVEAVKDAGRTITRFREGTPPDVTARIPSHALFGLESDFGSYVAAEPKLVGDEIRLARAVRCPSTIQVYVPDGKAMESEVVACGETVRRRGGLDNARVSAALLVACVGPYRERGRIGLDVPRMAAALDASFPGAALVGALMDGEIGLDAAGAPALCNWSAAQVLIGDRIAPNAQFRLAFDAFARRLERRSDVASVDAAMAAVMACVEELGYPGGMISLVFEDEQAQWVIAQAAHGPLWQKEVLPRTQRPLSGDDILAQVVRDKKPRYVADASDPTECCDREAARKGQVFSFYVTPLLDEHGDAFGTFQIDLGDRRGTRSLAAEELQVLNLLGSMAATLIMRAVHRERVDLMRKLDAALMETTGPERTLEEAACAFVRVVVDALGANGGYVRLFDPKENKLELIGGVGDYYDAAKLERRVVLLDDKSSSAQVVEADKKLVANDLTRDWAIGAMKARFPKGPLGQALQRVASYANLSLGNGRRNVRRPRGMFNITSYKAWFFTQFRLEAIKDVCDRLCLLIGYVRQNQDLQRSVAELAFCRAAEPTVEQGSNFYEALARQLGRLREAAKADAASCYLWDEEQQRYVLRAQSGWKCAAPEPWIDAAYYARGEGMTGDLAQRNLPRHIPNLRDYKAGRGETTGKYVQQVFGSSYDDNTVVEVIAVPLRDPDGRSLGIVTLHRQRRPGEAGESGFATAEAATLYLTGQAFAMFVSALCLQDEARWRGQELERLAVVNRILLHDMPTGDMLAHVCEAIVSHCGAAVCLVHRLEEGPNPHVVEQRYPRDEAVRAAQSVVAARDDALEMVWKALGTKDVVESRARPSPDMHDPVLASRVGRVERICVPIVSKGSPPRVLDVRFNKLPGGRATGLLPRYSRAEWSNLKYSIEEWLESRRLRAERQQYVIGQLRAQRALDALGLYLHRSVHDLVKGTREVRDWLQLWQEGAKQYSSSEIVQRSLRATERLTSILNRSQEAAGSFVSTKRVNHQVDKLLNEAMGAIRPKAEAASIRMTDFLVPVQACVDARQILECFQIVLDNAVKAMAALPPGKGRELNVSLSVDRGDVCEVQITDTGPGMEQQQIDRLLGEPSSLAETTMTGIGLFLARLYCENHGGKLRIESNPGAGTTVKVRFPLREQEGEA